LEAQLAALGASLAEARARQEGLQQRASLLEAMAAAREQQIVALEAHGPAVFAPGASERDAGDRGALVAALYGRSVRSSGGGSGRGGSGSPRDAPSAAPGPMALAVAGGPPPLLRPLLPADYKRLTAGEARGRWLYFLGAVAAPLAAAQGPSPPREALETVASLVATHASALWFFLALLNPTTLQECAPPLPTCAAHTCPAARLRFQALRHAAARATRCVPLRTPYQQPPPPTNLTGCAR